MSATMVSIRIPSDAVSSAGRAAHDAGLAALLGGNLYGRVALHPALAGIGEKSERGKVVNRAWRRYGWNNVASLLAIAAGWAGARVNEARPSSLSPRERALAKDKDAAVAAVALTGAPRRSRACGSRAARRTALSRSRMGIRRRPRQPSEAARLKRRLNALSTANLAAELALVGVNGALGQATSASRRCGDCCAGATEGTLSPSSEGNDGQARRDKRTATRPASWQRRERSTVSATVPTDSSGCSAAGHGSSGR
jgi:hypothetical protein